MKKEAKKEEEKKPGIKLDIACGQRKQAGFVGIDWAKGEGVDIVHDLRSYPWPIESESVAEAHCSHYIEHIPLTELPDGKTDHLFAFFDELYRILEFGGKVTVIAPYYASSRCWQDPTHRRAICEATFLYANKKWREDNLLNHYNITCDFDFTYGYGIGASGNELLNGKNEVYRGIAVKNWLNVVDDIHVVLTKTKRP